MKHENNARWLENQILAQAFPSWFSELIWFMNTLIFINKVKIFFLLFFIRWSFGYPQFRMFNKVWTRSPKPTQKRDYVLNVHHIFKVRRVSLIPMDWGQNGQSKEPILVFEVQEMSMGENIKKTTQKVAWLWILPTPRQLRAALHKESRPFWSHILVAHWLDLWNQPKGLYTRSQDRK